MSGRHPYGEIAYAAALAAGQGWDAVDVPEWSTGLTIRPAPGGAFDAAGPYPRTPLPQGCDLAAGLTRLREQGCVSVVLVPDPLCAPTSGRLDDCFEPFRPFKTHLLVERGKGYAPSKHHRDEIRRGLRRCEVQQVALASVLTEWRALYAALVERHAITGVAAFPDPYFSALAQMPPFVTLAAYVGGEVAGMVIWFERDGVAVSHLAATNALGYANGANYALNDAAISHFGGAAVVDLGGGAGAHDDPGDGLFKFKQGFANARTTAYLCGAVLDPARYAALTTEAGGASGFFPAYRAGGGPAAARATADSRAMSEAP